MSPMMVSASCQHTSPWLSTFWGASAIKVDRNCQGRHFTQNATWSRPMVVASSSGGPRNFGNIQPPSGNLIMASGSGSGSDLYLPFKKPVVANMAQGSLDELLEIVRERRGLWHEYSEALTGLYNQGLNSQMIDEMTGMTGVEQNMIVTGAQVYKTLKKGGLSPKVMQYFDLSGAEALYDLRLLAVSQRAAAAEYAAQENLTTRGMRDLVRAIKDHERGRAGITRDGFSAAPGDCLAFSYYRLALESRREEERRTYVDKGVAAAVTESARQKVADLLKGDVATVQAVAMGPKMPTLRLLPDEGGFRMVPYAGALATCTPAELQTTQQPTAWEGVFGVVSAPAGGNGGGALVALPGWRQVLAAKVPVALEVASAKALPGRQGTLGLRAQPLSEPALLVVDLAGKGTAADDLLPLSFYLAEGEGGQLALASGAELQESGLPVLASVVVAVLPPDLTREEEEIADWE